jgi:hypothetical protein
MTNDFTPLDSQIIHLILNISIKDKLQSEIDTYQIHAWKEKQAQNYI